VVVAPDQPLMVAPRRRGARAEPRRARAAADRRRRVRI